MVLQSQAAIIQDSPNLLMPEENLLGEDPEPMTETEFEQARALQKGALKTQALSILVETTGAQASDILEAEILANTISSIISSGPEEEDETLSTNGLGLAKKATSAYEVSQVEIHFFLVIMLLFLVGACGFYQ